MERFNRWLPGPDEHPPLNAVYCGMRVLCVGRHAFLSEHLCRVCTEAGAECEPAVGATEAFRKAGEFEPHVVVSDCELVTPALLDAWAADPALADVPVLAVSLTRRTENKAQPEMCGPIAAVYLPALDRDQLSALLTRLHRPRGIATPTAWRLDAPASSVPTG
jgi:chemotaxis response regulator CheB